MAISPLITIIVKIINIIMPSTKNIIVGQKIQDLMILYLSILFFAKSATIPQFFLSFNVTFSDKSLTNKLIWALNKYQAFGMRIIIPRNTDKKSKIQLKNRILIVEVNNITEVKIGFTEGLPPNMYPKNVILREIVPAAI